MDLQDQGIGLQHVAYHARKMNKHKVHYHVHLKELLAARDVLLKFRCYLDGAAGFYGNYGPRHIATLLSAARFVSSTGAMATGFSALLARDRHRVQEGRSQSCGCSFPST
jgi:hypothetical protein